MKLRITSNGEVAGTFVEWEDGSAFDIPVTSVSMSLSVIDIPRATVECLAPVADCVVEADVFVTNPATGDKYKLVRIEGDE